MRKLTLLLGFAVVFAATSFAQNVKINELKNGGNIWIEIVNLDLMNPAVLDGWTLQAAWDNPANLIPEIQFTFPIGTTLMPMECLVVEEIAGASLAPMGTQTFVLPAINPEGVAGVPWFLGLPLSVALYDNAGNGVDYLALGSVNAFDTPFAQGMGTPTTWTSFGMGGAGVPVLGGITFGANAEMTYRHSRTDTDSTDDWTNTVIANATPGVPNHFQFDPLDPACGFAPPTVTFTASTTSGCPPLLVGFTNTSTGPCFLDPMLGSSQVWDFDALNNPGVNTGTDWHESNTFTLTSDVTLTIIDSFGNMITSASLAINVLGSGMLSIRNVPTAENFEMFPPFVANPCTGTTGPDPVTGIEHSRTGNGRMRITDQNTVSTTVGFAIGNATASSGPMTMTLDSINTSDLSRAIVHFDGTQGGATGYRIRFFMYENFDESHPQDTIFIQDGVTTGNRVNANGTYAAVPGHNGFREVLLADWNTVNNANGGSRVWIPYDIVVTYAQLAAGGIGISGDMTLGISQLDNVTFEGNDGIMVDSIQILPEPPLPSLGQPCTIGQACLDINGALNANLNPVGNVSDPNGPYFSSAPTGTMNFTFTGAPNRAIILAVGNLSVAAQSFGAVGQLDIAPATVIADGFGQTGFLPFAFVTDLFGTRTLTLSTGGGLPMGSMLTFQAALLLPGAPFVRLSNAVEVTF